MANSNPVTNRLTLALGALLLIVVAVPPALAQKKPAQQAGYQTTLAEKAKQSHQDLIEATESYKASLEKLIALYETDAQNQAERLGKLKTLFEQGLIARRELDTQQQAIDSLQAKISNAQNQITQADSMIVEVLALDEQLNRIAQSTARLSKYTTVSIKYTGTRGWSISEASFLQQFYLTRFGRQLPITAFGQSATHDKLGYDHHNAMDVGVHPDSAEGQALMEHLRANGIPFQAFRQAVPGSSTGAHIHIGFPSRKF